MTDGRHSTGAAGEALAVRRLEAAGYHILTTQWRCSFGEIDIVARQHDELVFIEVRTRHNAELGAALESIGARKQNKLIRLAQAYLMRNHLEDAAWRIDVVAVIFQTGAPAQVEIIENAVGW